MKWSKLKQNIEDRFAESVKGRVELFSTTYRKPNSRDGRGWITIDKKEIVNFASIKSWWNFRAYYHEGTATDYLTHKAVELNNRTEGNLIEEGEFSRFDLHECAWEYLNLSIEEAINHKSPLIQTIAVLDRRLGKRRLKEIDTSNLDPLVKYFLEFRIAVENINTMDNIKL